MTKLMLSFSPQQTVAQAEAMLEGREVSGAPVLGENGSLQGVLTVADIQRVPPEERKQRKVVEAMNKDVLAIHADDTLDEALEQLTSHRVSWAPVVDLKVHPEGPHVIGILSARDIMRAYRETLAKSSRRMRGLVEGTIMIEEKIQQGMRLAGRPLREAHLPPESLVVSIRRKDELLFPRGSVVIEPGDVVTFLVSPSGEERLQKYLAEREKNADSAPLHPTTIP
jgi:CIC family chloride channel protein